MINSPGETILIPKKSRMLVVRLRGVNLGFLSYWGVQDKTSLFLVFKASFKVHSEIT